MTVQIGDATALARAIHIPVMHDFRAADVAAGGQGAPFVPVYHRALAQSLEREGPLVGVNIGGVSNITYIDGADTLIAGTGLATLIGGTGNDTFVINNASDVITEAEGRWTVTAAPPSGERAMVTRPPGCWTSWCTMGRPRPEPPALVEKKGSKILGRLAAEIPAPRSITLNSA